MAKTRKNPGKRFVTCSKCNVYDFLDDDLPSEYYKELLYGMFQKQKQSKKHMDYEQVINVLAMEKSRLEEELRATKLKIKLYDRSKEDDVTRISTSIYVTNFPDSFSAKDLFHLCKQYGHVVDSFIPTKRSKNGKRFGFVRFINVFNEERLVNNLCTVWSGRFKLQANIARFQRTPVNGNMNFRKDEGGFMGKNSHMNKKDNGNSMAKEPTGSGNTYVQVVKGDVKTGGRETESIPVVFLDDECLMSNDFSMSLLGRVKEFAVGSWFSQIIEASRDFVTNGRIAWVEVKGVPFKLWSHYTFKRIADRWGKLLDVDDQEETCYHSKRLCIHTKSGRNILESFKIIHRGKAHWIRACETPRWVPDFTDESYEEYQEDDMSNGGGAKEHIPGGGGMVTNRKMIWLVGLRKKNRRITMWKREMWMIMRTSSGGIRVNGISKANSAESGMSSHFKTSSLPRTEGSIMGILDEVVKGQVMGYNMEGCKSNMADIIGSQGVEENGEVVIMGDFNEVRYKSDRYGSKFNAHSAMVFNSFILNSGLVEVSLGGCSFTWCHKTAAKMSKLDRFLVSESFLNSCPNINAITLERYLSDHRPILLRDAYVDYGPTPSNALRNLTGNLKHLKNDIRVWNKSKELEVVDLCIDNGNGTVEDIKKRRKIINKLQDIDKLHALETAQKAKVKWAVEGDENSSFFHGKLKHLKNDIRVWNKTKGNSNRDAKAQLKLELEVVDLCIDNGNETVEVIKRRRELVNKLQDIDKLHALEMAQKAKVKWAVESDENSSFFHGILNKKRNLLNIPGVMSDGVWMDNPIKVKKEFRDHFSKRFCKPGLRNVNIQMTISNQISVDQKRDLEGEVTNDEIKKAVWDCSTDKAPGPDGFTFGFYRKFWYLIDNDVCDAVRFFFKIDNIPNGCNSSFIALIPKIPDANMVKKFRPISLVGSVYKIIAKIWRII
nr:RNA-directed DNA polymerase, eukaryota [Tanacetum cinerariifolium]